MQYILYYYYSTYNKNLLYLYDNLPYILVLELMVSLTESQ